MVYIIPGFGPFRYPVARGPVRTLRVPATRPTGTSPIPGPSNPGRACAAGRARSCTRRRRPRPWRCHTSRRPCRPGEACRIPRPRWRTRGRCAARHGRNGTRDRPRRHARRPMIPPAPAPAAALRCPWRRRTPGRRSRGRARRRRTPCSRTSRWPCARRRCRPRAAGPGAPASNPRPTRPGPPPAPLAGLAVTDVPPRRTPLTPDSRTTLVTRLRPIPAGSRPCADNRARVSCLLPWFHHLPSR